MSDGRSLLSDGSSADDRPGGLVLFDAGLRVPLGSTSAVSALFDHMVGARVNAARLIVTGSAPHWFLCGWPYRPPDTSTMVPVT